MGTLLPLANAKLPNPEPNSQLIAVLKDVLAMAERGELQSFIGTGFTAEGQRLATWCDANPNVYEMLGALSWLQHEYVQRQTER